MARRLGQGTGKKDDLTSLSIKMVVGVFLLFIAFPIGVIMLVVYGKPFYEQLKRKGVIQTNVEGKSSVNWNKAKQSGWEVSRETTRRVKTHVSESDIMDEKLPRRRHSHDPITYSYGSCSTENRLEQLKDLKNAGILDEVEFQQRKARLLSRR